MRRLDLIACCLALLVAAPAPRAEDVPKPAPAASANALPADVTTVHTLRVGDRELAYAATVGALPLSDAKGEKRADMAYVAYAVTAGGGEHAARRPITFVFNGGPGAASAYLLLGA